MKSIAGVDDPEISAFFLNIINRTDLSIISQESMLSNPTIGSKVTGPAASADAPGSPSSKTGTGVGAPGAKINLESLTEQCARMIADIESKFLLGDEDSGKSRGPASGGSGSSSSNFFSTPSRSFDSRRQTQEQQLTNDVTASASSASVEVLLTLSPAALMQSAMDAAKGADMSLYNPLCAPLFGNIFDIDYSQGYKERTDQIEERYKKAHGLSGIGVEEAPRLQAPGLVLVVQIICSNLRHVKYPQMRIVALLLLVRIGLYSPDDVILQRILPFLVASLEDSCPAVRATAVRAMR